MALYIGAAIAGFVLLGVASLVLVASQQLRNYLAAREGAHAADVLESGGPSALRAWMRDPNTFPEGVALYVLDGTGRDLDGKLLPAQYQNFVERFVLAGTRSESDNFRPIRLAPLLVAPDGIRYAFLLLPDRIAPWDSPAALAAVIAIALLVIAVVAAVIARAFGKPITELQLSVRALARGRVAIRKPASVSGRDDEIGALARDFDSMAKQIESLLTSCQQLMRDMSHELRSLLARLQAALALTERKKPLPAPEHQRILTELERMNQAIGDVLRFTRLEAEPIQVKHLLRIDELLTTLVADESDEALTHEVRLELQLEQDLAVVGDPQVLRSGFENVLRNAIRHAPAGSAVEVRARRSDGDSIAISIEDRGPGFRQTCLSASSSLIRALPQPAAMGPAPRTWARDRAPRVRGARRRHRGDSGYSLRTARAHLPTAGVLAFAPDFFTRNSGGFPCQVN